MLERSTDDIYRIIFCNGEFLNKLNILNVDRVFEDNRYYPELLQLCYFFYIMNYFIFPQRKFFDLFKETKWSAENTVEASTSYEIFERFMMNGIFGSAYYYDLNREYELLHDRFSELYFACYQDYYDSYSGDDFGKYIAEMNKELIYKCNNKASEIKIDENPKRRLLSFLKRYEALCAIDDMLRNTDDEIFRDAAAILDKIDIETIEKYADTDVNANDWNLVFVNEMFLCSILGKDRLNFTDRIRLKEARIENAVDRIIAFEYAQYDLHNVKDGTFTFVKKDGDDFYINMADLYIIAAARFYLPQDIKYYSKRTSLKNKSDAYKSDSHSIRRALKSEDEKSALLINVFRILCRMLKACIEEGEDDFYNFELSMNRSCIIMQREAEKLDTLEESGVVQSH